MARAPGPPSRDETRHPCHHSMTTAMRRGLVVIHRPAGRAGSRAARAAGLCAAKAETAHRRRVDVVRVRDRAARTATRRCTGCAECRARVHGRDDPFPATPAIVWPPLDDMLDETVPLAANAALETTITAAAIRSFFMVDSITAWTEQARKAARLQLPCLEQSS